MRLFAHVWSDGSVDGFVALPEGDAMAMVVPPAGAQVCEITEHELEDGELDLERLARLRNEYTVDMTPARGRLVDRKPDKAN